MKGLTIFEAMNDMNDDLIMSAAITNTSKANLRRPSVFRRFINSGWGVAAVCALVSVSVLGGIIWAGLQPDPKPPISTDALTEAPATETETLPQDLPTEEPEETVPEPVRGTEMKEEYLSFFTPTNGILEITDQKKLRIKGSWNPTDVNNSPWVTINVLELMKAFSDETTELQTPGVIFMKLTYENFNFTPEGLGAIWGKTTEKADIQGAHIKLYYSPYETRDVYLIIRTPNDPAFAQGEIPYLYFNWFHNSSQAYCGDKAVVFEEISFYPTFETAIKGLTDRVGNDGHPLGSLQYSPVGDDKSRVYAMEYNQPVLIIPSVDDEGRQVISVANAAFEGNDLLYQVIVSEGVKCIERRAFSFCDSLTEVYLPDSLEYIEDSAFTSTFMTLKEIHLGKNLKYVGRSGLPFVSNGVLSDIYYNGTMEEFKQIYFEDPGAAPATVHCIDGDLPLSEAIGEHSSDLPVYAIKNLDAFLATAEAPRLRDGERAVDLQARQIKVPINICETRTYVLRYGIVEDTAKDNACRLYFDVLSLEDGKIVKVGLSDDDEDYQTKYLMSRRYSGMIYTESSYAMDDGTLFVYFYDNIDYSPGYLMTFGFIAYTFDYEDGALKLRTNMEMAETTYSYKNERLPHDFYRAYHTIENALETPKPGGEGRLMAVITPCGDRVVFPSAQTPLVENAMLEKLFAATTSVEELYTLGLDGMYQKYGIYKKES